MAEVKYTHESGAAATADATRSATRVDEAYMMSD